VISWCFNISVIIGIVHNCKYVVKIENAQKITLAVRTGSEMFKDCLLLFCSWYYRIPRQAISTCLSWKIDWFGTKNLMDGKKFLWNVTTFGFGVDQTFFFQVFQMLLTCSALFCLFRLYWSLFGTVAGKTRLPVGKVAMNLLTLFDNKYVGIVGPLCCWAEMYACCVAAWLVSHSEYADMRNGR